MDVFNAGIRLTVLLLLAYKHTSGETPPILDPDGSENIQFQQHPHVVDHSNEETFLSHQPKSSQDNAKYNSDSDDINKDSKSHSPGIDDDQVTTWSVGPDQFYYFTSKNSQKSILGQQLDFSLFEDVLKTLTYKDQERLDVYKIPKLNNLVLPLRAQLSVEITVFNPFPKKLEVVEVFGGGPSYQLVLPSGKMDDRKKVWEITPYQTKPIIKFIFSGRTKNNHTTNIGILLSNHYYLNIPINILILPKPGLYSPELIIDFGFIFKNRMLSTKALKLCNSAKSSNTVKDITSDAQYVTVSVFNEVEVPPQSCTTGHVALITHYWDYERYARGQVNGQLTVKGVKGGELNIPYNARLLLGDLAYEEDSLHFIISEENDSTSLFKTFSITNNFASDSVAISKIRGFNPVVLRPNHSVQLFRIVCFDVSKFQKELVTSLEIKTNTSDLTIPLMAYSGLLLDIIPRNFTIKFPINTTVPCHTYIVVANQNPVPVQLEDWGTSYMPYATLTLVEMNQYDSSEYTHLDQWSRPKVKQNLAMPPIMLPAKHYAIFQLMVHEDANQKPKIDVDLWIQTPYQRHHKLLMLPEFKHELLVMNEPLAVKNCHPGAICTVDVYVRSWLNEAIILNSIVDDVTTEKIQFDFSSYPTVEPQVVTLAGQVRWIPANRKSSDNYIGLNTTEKAKWLSSIPLSKLFKASNMEFSWFYHRLEKYHAKVINQKFKHNFLLESLAKNKCHFKVMFDLKWPKFVQNELKEAKTDVDRHQTILVLPTAEVNGEPKYQKIVVKNTFKSRDLTMQFAMYAKPYECNITDFLKLHDHEVQSLKDSRDDWELMLNNTSPYRREVLNTKKHKYNVHNETILFVLPPQEQLEVLIRFWPKKQGESRAVLFIRNDATVLESVSLKGKAVHPAIMLRSDIKPTRVVFDLGSKSVIERLCNKQKFPDLNRSETKAFELINPYSRVVTISDMKINGVSCGFEGIRILNCKKLTLLPKDIREISIELNVDFTLKYINFQLEILTTEKTDDSEDTYQIYKYELLAFIPLKRKCCQYDALTSDELNGGHDGEGSNWLYKLDLIVIFIYLFLIVALQYISKYIISKLFTNT